MDGLTEETTASRESQEPSVHPKGTCRDAETGPVAHYRDFSENISNMSHKLEVIIEDL